MIGGKLTNDEGQTGPVVCEGWLPGVRPLQNRLARTEINHHQIATVFPGQEPAIPAEGQTLELSVRDGEEDLMLIGLRLGPEIPPFPVTQVRLTRLRPLAIEQRLGLSKIICHQRR